MTEELALSVRGVRKRYGGRDVLKGVSLSVARASCFTIFGPNGAGKTTLLRMLATLSSPSEGEITIAGHALPKQAEAARRELGVLLDHHLIPRDFTLARGLRYYADLYGLGREANGRIEALADRFGLQKRLRDPIRTFSRGMAQAAGLCRALLHDPAVLLLDEPFSALDEAACRVVEEVIAERKLAGKTVILVTHDADRGAQCADTAAVLLGGRIAVEGPPDAARDRLREAFAPAGGPMQVPER